MINLQNFAISMLQNSPAVANNPRAKEYLKVIQEGDSVKGQQLAENLCRSYGIKPEDAINQAKAFFKF